jgi:AcrR family transcriptional regulator
VAETLGVFPGLVSHYFASADDLVAAAFAHAASAEREEIFGHAAQAGYPVDQVRRLLGAWLHQDRDPVSLLWLDAWQASRRRPALMDEVARQMNADLARLSALIEAGIAARDFPVAGAPDIAARDRATGAGATRNSTARDIALQILSLVDGLSVQAAARATLDYTAVRAMVISTTESLLGLGRGTLR